jgi:16S rRNA (cytidine1402-2'-O)-methyltransferase
MNTTGAPNSTLYLIPTPLNQGEGADSLPLMTLQATRKINHFVVENAKTARAHLKRMGHPKPLAEVIMSILDEHTPQDSLPTLLQPLRDGHCLGLMSEAGCPAVADPGAALVALAHQQGFQVMPLPGPSSLMLALMASGLEGQRFAFHGYLPVEETPRREKILLLEKRSRQNHETQQVIETPYRNATLWQSLLKHLSPSTRLAVACDLESALPLIATKTVATWRAQEMPLFQKRPVVYSFLA